MQVIDNPINDVSFSAAPMPTIGSESGLQCLIQEQEVVLTAAHVDLRQRQWLEEHAKDWAVQTYGPHNIVEQDSMILGGNHPYKGHLCFTKSIESIFLVIHIDGVIPALQRVAYSNISLLRHQFHFTLDGTEVNLRLAADCMAKFAKLRPPSRPRTHLQGPLCHSPMRSEMTYMEMAWVRFIIIVVRRTRYKLFVMCLTFQ
jgi:hypothetical protein